jgi:hypothetical protein
MHDVVANDRYFQQKCDASNIFGFSSIHKCIVALKMLTYGVTTNACGVYCRLGKSIVMEALQRFCKVVKEYFEIKYLWQPSKADLNKQLQINVDRGYQGMFTILHYMHNVWKNYPMSWQIQFNDKNKNNKIILEIIANQSLWF